MGLRDTNIKWGPACLSIALKRYYWLKTPLTGTGRHQPILEQIFNQNDPSELWDRVRSVYFYLTIFKIQICAIYVCINVCYCLYTLPN